MSWTTASDATLALLCLTREVQVAVAGRCVPDGVATALVQSGFSHIIHQAHCKLFVALLHDSLSQTWSENYHRLNLIINLGQEITYPYCKFDSQQMIVFWTVFLNNRWFPAQKKCFRWFQCGFPPKMLVWNRKTLVSEWFGATAIYWQPTFPPAKQMEREMNQWRSRRQDQRREMANGECYPLACQWPCPPMIMKGLARIYRLKNEHVESFIRRLNRAFPRSCGLVSTKITSFSGW